MRLLFAPVIPRHTQERCVCCSSVEQFRIEVVACPYSILLSFLAVRFPTQDSQHLFISMRATHILRWARTFSGNNPCFAVRFAISTRDFFDTNVMMPVVAEVVSIEETMPPW